MRAARPFPAVFAFQLGLPRVGQFVDDEIFEAADEAFSVALLEDQRSLATTLPAVGVKWAARGSVRLNHTSACRFPAAGHETRPSRTIGVISAT